MFKILIADDESFIRKGIVAILRRSIKLDSAFFEAENGIEALKICNDEMPEIVITDIRMPCCNGLELVQKIRELYSSRSNNLQTVPNVIIISGYEDFEYAQKALKLGVKDYLIKPINKQELTELINTIIDNIVLNEEVAKQKHVYDRAVFQMYDKVRNNLLVEFVNSNNKSDFADILEKLKGINIVFEKTVFICMVIQYKVHFSNEDYIDFAVKNIIDEMFHDNKEIEHYEYFNSDIGEAVIIFETDNKEKFIVNARTQLAKIISVVKKCLDINIIIASGEVVYEINDINNSFVTAMKASNFKIYENPNKIIFYSDLIEGQKQKKLTYEGLLFKSSAINSFEIVDLFSEICNVPASKSSILTIIEGYYALIDSIYNELEFVFIPNKDEILKPLEFNKLWSFTQMRQELINFIESCHEIIQSSLGNVANKKLLSDVIRFVHLNATKDINLNIAAEHFSKSPGYISTLFKKGTNEFFIDYITNLRINLAKKMLKNSNISIGEISKMCGYQNSKYFSVVFKKITGGSPSDYRQINIDK